MSKKILIVSDYIDSDLGGIETYIYQVKKILQKQWFEIKIVWYKTKKSKFKKLFFLLLSFFNIHWFFKLRKTIKNFKPDIIRLHSIARAFWPIWILPIKFFNWKILIMYHDLGYFHPFASNVTEEKQLVLPLTFKWWIKSLKNYCFLKKIYWIFKYFKLYFLKKILIKYVDIHIVPSDFMVDILKKRWIKKKKIRVLKHFILQE